MPKINSYQLPTHKKGKVIPQAVFDIAYSQKIHKVHHRKGVLYFFWENDVTMWRIKALHNCDGNMNKAVELLMEKAER